MPAHTCGVDADPAGGVALRELRRQSLHRTPAWNAG